MSIIALHSIGKKYGQTTVLRNINLAIATGERSALVGRSGSGKTTILRILCGLETSTSGQVVRGSAQYNIGYVPQSPSLLHSQTVRNNILLPVRALRHKEGTYSQVYEKIIDTLGLRSLQDSYPYQLSRGQAQRVSLARGLILQPDLLILDEPFASLDEFTKEELDDALLGLNREFNTAILLVTHSIEEAVYVAETVYVLREDEPKLRVISTHLESQHLNVTFKTNPSFVKAVAEVRRAL